MNLAILILSGASQLSMPAPTPIVLDGQYSQRSDEISLQIIGERVCFVPDKSQWGRLPRPAATHDAWFCFSNDAEARKLLRVPARQADNCGWQAREIGRAHV